MRGTRRDSRTTAAIGPVAGTPTGRPRLFQNCRTFSRAKSIAPPISQRADSAVDADAASENSAAIARPHSADSSGQRRAIPSAHARSNLRQRFSLGAFIAYASEYAGFQNLLALARSNSSRAG